VAHGEWAKRRRGDGIDSVGRSSREPASYDSPAAAG